MPESDTLKLLSRFCADKDDIAPTVKKFRLFEPWTCEDYTYASDAIICVRVKRIATVPTKIYPARADLLFEEVWQKEPLIWQKIPSYADGLPCAVCYGKQFIAACADCGGSGCDTCFGMGFFGVAPERMRYRNVITSSCMPCPECEGTGYEPDRGVLVEGSIDKDISIAKYYLNKIVNLPNIEIAPIENNKPFPFRWVGGEGVLHVRKT